MINKTALVSGSKRVAELDLMRILLTITVILGHSRYLDWVPYDLINGDACVLPANVAYWGNILCYADKLCSFIYGFHMPLFFVLSGIVAYLTKETTFSSFDKLVICKARRLLIPYVVYGLLWMIPWRVFAQVYNKENISTGLEGLFNFTYSGHLWFLPALFCIFVMFYPFYILFAKRGGEIAICIVSFIFTQLIKLVPIHFLNFDTALSYFSYFAVGFSVGSLLYGEKIGKINYSARKLWIITIFSLLISIIFFFYCNLNFVPANVLLVGISMWSFCVIVTKYTSIANTTLFNSINSNCMRIYLFSDPLNFPILYIAYRTSFLAYAWGCYLMYFCRTVGISLVSYFLSICVEKVKPLLYKLYIKIS